MSGGSRVSLRERDDRGGELSIRLKHSNMVNARKAKQQS